MTENRKVVTEGVLVRLLGNNPDLEGHSEGLFSCEGLGLDLYHMFF